MNLNETKAILKEVAVIDNRKLDEAVALAWHAIIGQMNFDVAKQALVLARQDASISYLEPKHIVQWGKEASHRLSRNQSPEDIQPKEIAREPLCRAHGSKILSCDECCQRVMEKAESMNMFEKPGPENNYTDFMFKGHNTLHAWTKENIYA